MIRFLFASHIHYKPQLNLERILRIFAWFNEATQNDKQNEGFPTERLLLLHDIELESEDNPRSLSGSTASGQLTKAGPCLLVIFQLRETDLGSCSNGQRTDPRGRKMVTHIEHVIALHLFLLPYSSQF